MKLLVPLPDLDEQDRIVARVSEQAEVASIVKSAIGLAQKREQVLRQALLASAFPGRLGEPDLIEELTGA